MQVAELGVENFRAFIDLQRQPQRPTREQGREVRLRGIGQRLARRLVHGRATPAGHRFVVITVDGEVAGIGGLHPTGVPDVVMFGMAVDLRWQGRGLGRQLQAWLLEESWRMGARRVELQVWEDNHRARALYTSGGFVEEGVQRCDGIRAGGYASSLNMALMRS